MNVTCDYYRQPAKLTSGAEIYPHLPFLHHKKIWACTPCKAWVGTHDQGSSTQPLGRLANLELRRLKMAAHAVFDPLWKGRTMSRTDAYQLLADRLGIPVNQCHIGMFDEDMCRRVVEVMKPLQSAQTSATT